MALEAEMNGKELYLRLLAYVRPYWKAFALAMLCMAASALAELGALVGMSTHQLVRAMKRATGLAPLAWRQNARIVHARHLLRDGVPIADAAHELGFTDQSHFHRVFQAHVAAPPGAYRRS